MVSEPLFSIYCAGESDAVFADEEPHDIKSRERKVARKMMLITRFIGWDYTASNLPKLDSATEVFCHFVTFFNRFLLSVLIQSRT